MGAVKQAMLEEEGKKAQKRKERHDREISRCGRIKRSKSSWDRFMERMD